MLGLGLLFGPFSADLSVGTRRMGRFRVGANALAWPLMRSESLDRPLVGISGLSAEERSEGGFDFAPKGWPVLALLIAGKGCQEARGPMIRDTRRVM